MLKRLRLKIVAVIMAITTVVLGVALGVTFAMSYASSYSAIHKALEAAVERGPLEVAIYSVGREYSSNALLGMSIGSPASTYETPEGHFAPVAVFLVDQSGRVLEDNSAFVTMDPEVQTEALQAALSSSKSEDYLPEQGVFYRYAVKANGIVVAFADSGSFFSSLTQTAIELAAIGCAAALCLLAVSVGLAHVVTRPVEQAWKQQGEFIANASHELKTPLTVILANNEILAAHPELPVGDQAKWVKGIQDEAEHMKALVDEMLTLAQTAETTKPRPQDLPEQDLSTIVRQASLSFDAVAFEAGVTIDDDVDDKVRVHGGEDDLARLVKILIDNAIKYAGMGGTVRVSLHEARRSHPVLSVNNTGACIDEADLPHVFDRFWRSDQARSRSKGSSYGLGLAIAKGIATSLGASIDARSNPEDGTTFTVSW